jgi:hypothetical protein
MRTRPLQTALGREEEVLQEREVLLGGGLLPRENHLQN